MNESQPPESNAPAGDQPRRIVVDDDWKAQVEKEKAALRQAESQAAPARQPKAEETAQPAADEAAQAETPSGGQALPPPTFVELVTLLATQASAAMGEAANNPQSKDAPQMRQLAQHFIDLLAVVEVKTQGNLEPDEARLLEGVLHELRMAFLTLKT